MVKRLVLGVFLGALGVLEFRIAAAARRAMAGTIDGAVIRLR